jgi:hypothetical protein
MVNCQLSIVNYPPPTTGHQQPATNWQLSPVHATIRRLLMMAQIPGLIPGLLLLGAAIVALVARYRPRFIYETAVAHLILALLLWLTLRGSLLNTPTSGWQVTPASWTLGGAWLLLLLTLLLLARFAPESADPASPRQPILLLLLGGAALAAAWAGTPSLLLTTWLLLALVWATAVYLSTPAITPTQAAAPSAWLLLAAFLLWYGAALASSPNLATWPPLARTPLLLAIFLQMGALPFAGWRNLPGSVSGRTAVLLHLAPTLAGAALLANFVATGPTPYLLLATLLGLFGLLAGLYRLWTRWEKPLGGLIWAQSSLLLLATLWAGPSATAAAGRVLLLATPLVYLLPKLNGQTAGRSRIAALAGWAITLGALAGLPLTAGFNGLAALYDAWLRGGAGFLLIPLALLLVGLLTAVTRLSHLFTNSNPDESPVPITLATWALPLLLILGLLALPADLATRHWLIWPALLLPLLAGLLLPRFVADWSEWTDALRRITAVRLPPSLTPASLRRPAHLITIALRDAALLLESERGLLWLLLLLALILLGSG